MAFLRAQPRVRRPGRHAPLSGVEALECRALLSGTPPTVTAVEVSSTQWSAAFVDYLAGHNLGDHGFRIPTGSSDQTKPLPWLNIDRISATFSNDVHVEAGDLALSGVGIPTIGVADFYYDAQTHVATWTLDDSLGNSKYLLELNASGLSPIADLAGNRLDGEWSDNSTAIASGNGVAGGDFKFQFTVLPGDVNKNQAVDLADVVDVVSRQGATVSSSRYSIYADLDGSGGHESSDLDPGYFVFGATTPPGSPLGASDGAPTAASADLVQISDPAVGVVLSLNDAFADADDADLALWYDVASVSDESLFDFVSVNVGNGELTFNAAWGASGRSEVMVSATDPSGRVALTRYVVDVNYENQPPHFEFVAVHQGVNTWLVTGVVTDPDDEVEGMYAEFVGAFDARATVQADGTFAFAVIVEVEDWGMETAHAVDHHGRSSNWDDQPIQLT
jgi:hypothetical protein